jgi:hypothetical protein
MGRDSFSIDDMFSRESNTIDVKIFGRYEQLPVRGDYPLPSYMISLIKDKLKSYGNILVMDNTVFVYVNGIVYRWTPDRLELVVQKE